VPFGKKKKSAIEFGSIIVGITMIKMLCLIDFFISSKFNSKSFKAQVLGYFGPNFSLGPNSNPS
jgi:hypothetical protein